MKVFHPNIHIVSNYMDFDEDVSRVSFKLGMEEGWGPPAPRAISETVNPNLGREGMLASCTQSVIYFFMPAKDSYL